MREIQLNCGRSVPVLGLGTWRMGEDAGSRAAEVRAIRHAIDIGMTLVDTAEMYGSGGAEEVTGEAIAGLRDQVFLVSKVLPENASYQGTLEACERSLKRLRTDHLDLYLLHWRGEYPMADTLEAFLRLKAEGKIRDFGVSNLDPAEMSEWMANPGAGATVVNQLEYNLVSRGIEYDLLPWLQDRGIAVMAYCPLAQGHIGLSGTVDWQGRSVEGSGLTRVAGRHRASVQQVMLAWVLRQPGVLAIAKSVSPSRLDDNVKATEIVLTEEDIRDLDRDFPPPKGPVTLAMT